MKDTHVHMQVLAIALASLLLPASVFAVGETYFVPIEPCRIFDTRIGNPTRFSGNGQVDSFHAIGSTLIESQGGALGGCGLPATATAIHVNFTAVNPSAFGYLRAWPYGSAEPGATLMVWYPGKSISNATALAIFFGAFDFTVKIYGGGTDLVADVVGYYVPVPVP